jgi:DNA-binding SARP family transcriptional activator
MTDHPRARPSPDPSDPEVNAALFGDLAATADLATALSRVAAPPGQTLIVADEPDLLADLAPDHRLGFADAALDASPIDPDAVSRRLLQRLGETGAGPVRLVVDMGWAIGHAQGASDLELWGAICERLSEGGRVAVVSLYDRELTIEEHLQAAFRAHRQFLAPSGLYENPHWIPAVLQQSAPLDEQLAFLLGRVVPDFAGDKGVHRPGQMYARGATPSWLTKPREMLGAQAGAARWHVRCLGQLRVYIGNRRVDWRLPGGAPKKTRTLFAYLLQSGEKGAHADQIGELLWPDDGSEEVKRARLHHTVAMLRKTLGSADAVLRAGEYYRLNAPLGSWIDIDTFEQLCRRGLSLFKRSQDDAALRIYTAAEQLYGGDLFEDLPLEYVENEHEDWCLPRRTWLREMALKLQYDFSKVMLRTGRTREALEHCQKALAIDPASEGANAQAMRIFMAQGRIEAMQRQYRAYRTAIAAIGAPEGEEIRSLYRDLTRPG